MGRRAGPPAETEAGPRGTQEGREALTRILTKALRDRNTDLLLLALNVALATGTDPDIGPLRAALQTPAREATCWYLTLVEPRRLPTELKDDATAPPSEGERPFGCEVLRRIVDLPPAAPPVAGLDVAPAREGAKKIPLALVVLEALSPAERKALSAARGEAPDELDHNLESLRREPAELHPPARRPLYGSAPDTVGLMDLSRLPRGLVPDVLAVTGCDGTKPGIWGGAEITYKPDGRALNVLIFGTNQSLGACQSAARLLFMTALGPAVEVPRRSGRHVLFVRLDRDAQACARAPREAVSTMPGSGWASVRVGGNIKEPKKTKHVAPVHPDSARQQGAQGTVILEAVISPSGCVRGATVVQQIDAALPVVMTVTVNFRLQ